MKTIILHGWAYDNTKWKPLIEELKRRGIEPTMPDIPVLTKKATEPWSIENYMAWLGKEVGQAPAVLIGHSNGGRLALNFAVHYPERVSHLILIDSAGIPRTELKSKLKRTTFKILAKVGKPLTKSESARRLLYKIAKARDYLDAEPIGRSTMINLLKSDYSLKLEKVQATVDIIWGRQDPMTPVKDAFTMQRRLPNAQKPFIIDDARHAPQFSHPKVVADYIAKVLN